MKKVMLLGAFAVLSLASCKKDYTCECTTTSDGETIGTSSSTFKATKKDAEASCDGSEATAGSLKTTCSLK